MFESISREPWYGIAFDFFAAAVIIIGAVLAVVLIGWTPGHIARRRGHPNAAAINVCGWLGLLAWPCWFVAAIWAYTGPSAPPAKKAEADQERALDPVPAEPVDTILCSMCGARLRKPTVGCRMKCPKCDALVSA